MPGLRRFEVLGSAAAEGVPAFFCGCPVCSLARRCGGRDRRFRTAYALGETVRFDFGPDSWAQNVFFGLDGAALRHLFITHGHEDHFHPWDLESLTRRPEPLHVYGDAAVLEKLKGFYFFDRIVFREMLPGDQVRLDEEDLRVTALEARHIPTETALLYLLERGGRRILIGNDTEYFPEATFEMLRNQCCQTVFLDCTWGAHERRSGHMGLPDNLAVMERLRGIGAADENTRMLPIHLCHGYVTPHEEFPVEMAYDGLEFDF